MRGRIVTTGTVVLTMLLSVATSAFASGGANPGPVDPGASAGGHCARLTELHVPGAERQQADCLDGLTTASTVASGHTVQADWAGLTSAGLPVPGGVPGIQVDGYFPDDSTTNANHGWNHDAQFVLRLPDNWNGGLVVSGSPGTRRQYANDRAIGDAVLAAGYAFAATDKGNTGANFFLDGTRPGDAIVEWNRRVTELTRAAKIVVAQRYRRAPQQTLAAGLSNGGYLVRWQLENHPELFDGGVDWEGTLWTTDGPNLLTSLPAALKNYPAAANGDPVAHQRMLDAGFAAGSEFLWPFHYRVYWDLTQRTYRQEVDPGYSAPTVAGTPYCASGTPGCDADYVYADRPESVERAVARIALTGRIGKPLITLHGTLDSLLPISQDSDAYTRLIEDSGRGALHRYYRIADGNHVDGLVDSFPDRLRPIAPCFRTAFAALTGWLAGAQPPASTTVPRPAGATPAELAASCPIA